MYEESHNGKSQHCLATEACSQTRQTLPSRPTLSTAPRTNCSHSNCLVAFYRLTAQRGGEEMVFSRQHRHTDVSNVFAHNRLILIHALMCVYVQLFNVLRLPVVGKASRLEGSHWILLFLIQCGENELAGLSPPTPPTFCNIHHSLLGKKFLAVERKVITFSSGRQGKIKVTLSVPVTARLLHSLEQ